MTERTPERKDSEAEVAAILSRAAELSVDAKPSATSLVDLERIGAEAGLSQAAIRQAAAELRRTGRPAGPPSFWARAFGRLRLRHETVLPGTLDDEGPQALLDEIQRELGLPGTLSQAGKAWVWSSTVGPQGGRAITVHISSKNGQTTVAVEERLGNLAGGIWGGVMGGAGSSLVAITAVAAGTGGLGALGALAVGGASLALSYGGTRALYEKLYQARADQVQRLFETVTDVVTEHAVLAPNDVGETTAAPASSHAEPRAEADGGSLSSALDDAAARQGVLPALDRDLVSGEPATASASVEEPVGAAAPALRDP